jgi:hypothetical protein
MGRGLRYEEDLWKCMDVGLKMWLKLMCFALAQEPGCVFRFWRVRYQEVGLGLIVKELQS